jgi:hypothetical protein
METSYPEELKSMKEDKVFELAILPKGRKTVKYKWVFKVKHDAYGKVERYMLESRIVC